MAQRWKWRDVEQKVKRVRQYTKLRVRTFKVAMKDGRLACVEVPQPLGNVPQNLEADLSRKEHGFAVQEVMQ